MDSHKIGIHPTDRCWIIIAAQREETAPSNLSYQEIHGKRVLFGAKYVPSEALLEDRMTHFNEKNKNTKDPEKTTRYCHFCLRTFDGKAGLEEKDAHVLECKVLSDVADLKV